MRPWAPLARPQGQHPSLAAGRASQHGEARERDKKRRRRPPPQADVAAWPVASPTCGQVCPPLSSTGGGSCPSRAAGSQAEQEFGGYRQAGQRCAAPRHARRDEKPHARAGGTRAAGSPSTRPAGAAAGGRHPGDLTQKVPLDHALHVGVGQLAAGADDAAPRPGGAEQGGGGGAARVVVCARVCLCGRQKSRSPPCPFAFVSVGLGVPAHGASHRPSGFSGRAELMQHDLAGVVNRLSCGS